MTLCVWRKTIVCSAQLRTVLIGDIHDLAKSRFIEKMKSLCTIVGYCETERLQRDWFFTMKGRIYLKLLEKKNLIFSI